MNSNNLQKVKENQLYFENNYLSPYAAKSFNSAGRVVEVPPCPIRTEFQRDRDRILHSKAFRRLKHKTQVFISPLGDHYRTRMTHTLEVSQISRTIARALRLNEDLTEAIALGHDLGHTPFGHTGEVVLNELLPCGFKHNEQSVRVVSIIENLNLTKETIDGLRNHTGNVKPATLEGQIVKIADRIAYLNHDIDDSIRANIMKNSDLPDACNTYFGTERNSRISTMVNDLIINSMDSDEIKMSDACREHMDILRGWMFENIYSVSSVAKKEELKARKIVTELFNCYFDMLKQNNSLYKDDDNLIKLTVADYIAGMTDRYAVKLYKDKFIPSPLNINPDEGFLLKLAEKNNLLKQ